MPVIFVGLLELIDDVLQVVLLALLDSKTPSLIYLRTGETSLTAQKSQDRNLNLKFRE